MSDKAKTSLPGADPSRIDHRDPSGAISAHKMMPAAVGNEFAHKPEFTRLATPLRSADLLANLRTLGVKIDTLEIPVYRSSKDGTPRKTDNSDMVRGYAPLYDDVSHLRSIRTALDGQINEFRDLLESKGTAMSGVRSMELQDLDKVTMQRGKYPGWFLQSPVDPSIRRSEYPGLFASIVRTILTRYASVVPDLLKKDWKELILMDYDPPDTMVGMPTMASGDQTHPARILTLAACYPPTVTPSQWLDGLSRIGESAGLPPYFTVSSNQSTRYGPTKKEIPLWMNDGYGYFANFTSKGFLPRVRLVYPTPYPINFVLSPTYVAWSTARMKIPGLWHTPELRDSYVAAMKRQGKRVYTIDFSGMDTTMPPHLIKMICSIAIEVGFHSWPLQLLSRLMDVGGLISPPWEGQWNIHSTWMRGMFPWMSGFKLTSEMDTIYGAATLLTCLEQQVPGIARKWASGNFVFAELGDDIIFTLDADIDPDKMIKDAYDLCGANIKLLPDDAMFLKTMLPLVPDVSDITKPVSRLVQQTFFNEDSYEGQGGVVPDAILRLGLMARADRLSKHPLAKDALRIFVPSLLNLNFIDRATADYKLRIAKGDFALDKGDVEAIQMYATRLPHFMDKLADQARYMSSAADTVRLLESVGITSNLERDAMTMRRLYMKHFVTMPKFEDYKKVHQMMTWLR